MKIIHAVEYFYPGAFFAESDTKTLKNYDEDEALKKMPQNAFAFQLFDRVEQTATLENGSTFTHKDEKNRSGKFYPQGKKMSLADVEREYGIDSILAANMKSNWKFVVKTRLGNTQPFEKNDRIM